MDFQWETVGEPFPLGFRGIRGKKEEKMVFKDLSPLLRTFSHCARAISRERVVSCCILNRQQLDCWDLVFFILSRQPFDC